MPQPRLSLPLISADPLHVSVTRGGAEESCHLVDLALCDADGTVLMGLGDIERQLFPRSAMKPLQAIALAELWEEMSEAGRLTPAEFSLICASHNGQLEHVKAVNGLLKRHNLTSECLSCGPQWSSDQQTLIRQARDLVAPDPVHNNCSGKHAGMLVLARLMGVEPDGYADITHPVQQRILGVLEAMTGIDLMTWPSGIDGCGAPALSAPLGNWARGMAMFAGEGEMSAGREAACARIRDGIAAAPHLIAGDRRLCSALAQSYGTKITAKTGAEGVYALSFHEFGLGAMLKVRDGNERAAHAAVGALLHALGYDQSEDVHHFTRRQLQNWAGAHVGEINVSGPLSGF